MMGALARATESTLGPYRIAGVLGRGGMGVVYRGEHLVTGHPVALKTVRAAAEVPLAALRREIHALRRVRHPGVVRVLDDGLSGGLPWVAMELLEGTTLRSHLQRAWRAGDLGPESPASATHTRELAGEVTQPSALADRATPAPRPVDTALPALLAIVQGACSALGFLHGEGIVHRDLKPENILVRPDGSPVLVDLGIAGGFGGAAGREELAAEGTLAGSLAYMAPEQTRADLVDARADLYALGCILYECVTGRPPFTGASAESLLYQHRNVAPVSPSERADGVPDALESLILGLLQKRPQDRIGYADDVAHALSTLGVTRIDARDLPEARPYLYRPDLAGREEATRTLEEALARAAPGLRSPAGAARPADGHGGCVLLGGESGAGKTRLAMELARTAARSGFTVITGQCAALGDGDRGIAAAPLHPMRPLLLAVADRCRARGAAEAGRLLGARGEVLSVYEPSLAGLSGADKPPPARSPEAARARALDALVGTVLAFAEAEPLLLLIDDLQWADDLSLAFLQRLALTDLTGRRALVVGAYRMEERSDALAALLRAPTVAHVELGRLDAPSVAAMVSGMLAMREPPTVLVDFLRRRSEGNPFFVAEHLRAAIADGLITRTPDGRWRFDERGAGASLDVALPLPDTLSSLLSRRLRDLDEDTLSLAQWAAVLGREVDGELLADQAGQGDPTRMEGIERLRVRQILEEPAPGQLRFVHDKIRDFAYSSIPEGARRGLHRRAGEAIEARSSGVPDAYPSLGHHFARADLPDKAGLYFTRAADRAKEAHASGDAIAFYRAALGEVRRLGVEERRVWSELPHRIHDRLGEVLALVGRHEEARDALETALSGAPGDEGLARSSILQRIGKTWEMRHHYEEALKSYSIAEEALGPAPEGQAPSWWDAWVQIQMARISVHYWVVRVDRMTALVDEVRPVVERQGTALQRARFFHALTQIQVKRERFAISSETLGHARDGLSAAEESGDEGEIAEQRFTLAAALLWRDGADPALLDEAAEQLARALSEAERLGDVVLQARCWTYLTMAHRRRRRVGDVRLSAERALAAATAGGNTEYIGATRAHLAWIALQGGDLAEAERSGQEALLLWSSRALVFPFQWTALLPLVVVALSRRDLAAATAHVRAALHPDQQRLPEALAAALERAGMVRRRGRADGVEIGLEKVVVLAQRFGYL